MVYVLNTLITPINFDMDQEVRIVLKRISVEEAKKIMAESVFESAIGHESTAIVLSKLLGIEIPAVRKSIYMKKGDRGIHFFLKERLPEGVVLTREQLETLDYWLVLSEVL
jgi:hypothetical protein